MTPKRKKTRAHDASKFHAVAIEGIRSLAGTKLERDHPTVSVPGYRLPSANTKLHWTQIKAQRQLGWRMAKLMPLALPCTVTLTRVAPRSLDGHDNARAAFKHVVDGIADGLVGEARKVRAGKRTETRIVGNDDDPRITWRYEQRRGPYAIEARHEVRG